MQKLALCLLVISSPVFSAENFATCVIDSAKDVNSDTAARAVHASCLGRYPGGFESVPQGIGRGEWFGYKSGAECATKLAAKTPSEQAGRIIYLACRKLYDGFDPSTARPFTGVLDQDRR